MADEERTEDRSGVRSGAQVKGLDPFGGNSTIDPTPDDDVPSGDTSDVADSYAGGGLAAGGHSTARGTGGTGIGIDGTGLGGTAGGEGDEQLDSGGSIPQ